MVKGRESRGTGGEEITPPRFPETPPPLRTTSGDYSLATLQTVMEMQRAIGGLTQAVTTLTDQQKEQAKKLDGISHKIYAAIVLLLAIGGMLTFFAKGINDLLVHRILETPPAQQQSPPIKK